MAVDTEFYRDVYGGTDYPDIDRLLLRAAEFIDGKITVSPSGEFQERQYNFAVCAQAEFMGFKGGYDMWFSETQSGADSSVKVGDFSMSSGSSAGRAAGNIPGMSSAALSYLEKAGLLYRGCPVCR